MLVLGRHLEESVMIGDDIEVRVVGVTPSGRVELGITAPKTIAVHRKEVFDSIQREAAANKAGYAAHKSYDGDQRDQT